MKGFYLYLLFSIFCSYSLLAQSFSTRVSSRVIGRNDRLQVEYVADNGSLSQFKLPVFNGWVVLSGPAVTSSQMIAGNVVKKQMIYSLTLVPKTTGRLLVPGASAYLDNKPVRTSPIYIEVKKTDHVKGSQQRPQQPQGSFLDPQPQQRSDIGSDQFLRPGESARDKINQNILVRVEANKQTAVVGEPVLITYKLFTRLRSQSKVVNQPSFTGATVIEMTNENAMPTRESLNGRMYNVYVVRRVQLIPLQEGPLTIPEAAVENKVAFYNLSGSNYRDLYYNPSAPAEEITVTAKNKPIQIQIQSLPPLPAVGPAEYSGAVGTFNISAAPAKNSIETNSTNYLVVVLVGEGNVQQMRPPVVKWPKGIEAFDPTVESNDDKDIFPVRTRKSFTFPFVVNTPGQYTIPPISFTYFDANANRYVTKQTVQLPLVVVKGAAKPTFVNENNGADNDFQNRLLIFLGAGVVAVIIGLVWFKERNNSRKPAAVAPAPVVLAETPPIKEDSEQYIYQIRELWPQENTAAFYKQLCSNVHKFIKVKLKIEPSQLQEYTLSNIRHIENLEKLQQLLDHCSLGMYTPVYTIEEAIQHRLQAIETLSRIDKEIS